MANFPTTAPSFATRSNGQVVDASHINSLQDEVGAIGDGYLNATARLNSSNSTVANLSVVGGSTFTGGVAFSSAATFSTATTVSNLKFPASQSASSDGNTLDDYEEGSWTPVIGGASGTSGQTYGVQAGRYIKVGKLVHLHCRIDLTNKGTISGAVEIQGIPAGLISENTTNLYSVTPIYFEAMATNWTSLLGIIAPNSQTITVRGVSAAGTSYGALATGDIGNTTLMILSITYRAAN